MGCCGRPDPKPKEPTLQQRLLDKWLPKMKQSDHIFTWTGYGELAYLAEQSTQATWAVEVGVYMGRSSKIMLDANPGIHLWAVDPFLVDGTYETTKYFLRDEMANGRFELARMYSTELAPMMEHMRGKLDLVFIDGAHDFPSVLTDIKTWAPMVRIGGVLCGHDYEGPPNYSQKNDVAKAVEFTLMNWWTEPVPRMWQFIKTREPVW